LLKKVISITYPKISLFGGANLFIQKTRFEPRCL
jgi:hypothetical protein